MNDPRKLTPGFLSVVEVDDPELIAGALFESRFNDKIPTFPRHFVALYRSADGEMHTAGYIHYSAVEAIHLAGGLVVAENLYRKMPKTHLAEIRSFGSIGEIVLRSSIPRLRTAAVFACIGDAMSATINMRVGLQPTRISQLYAMWNQPASPQTQDAVAARIAKLMPF